MKVFICSIVERCFCWKSRPWSGSRSQKGFLLAHPKSGDRDRDRDGEDGELFLGAGGRAA